MLAVVVLPWTKPYPLGVEVFVTLTILLPSVTFFSWKARRLVLAAACLGGAHGSTERTASGAPGGGTEAGRNELGELEEKEEKEEIEMETRVWVTKLFNIEDGENADDRGSFMSPPAGGH
jgi:hypothetical protein